MKFALSGTVLNYFMWRNWVKVKVNDCVACTLTTMYSKLYMEYLFKVNRFLVKIISTYHNHNNITFLACLVSKEKVDLLRLLDCHHIAKTLIYPITQKVLTPNLKYLLIMTRCRCITKALTLKANFGVMPLFNLNLGIVE